MQGSATPHAQLTTARLETTLAKMDECEEITEQTEKSCSPCLAVSRAVLELGKRALSGSANQPCADGRIHSFKVPVGTQILTGKPDLSTATTGPFVKFCETRMHRAQCIVVLQLRDFCVWMGILGSRVRGLEVRALPDLVLGGQDVFGGHRGYLIKKSG